MKKVCPSPPYCSCVSFTGRNISTVYIYILHRKTKWKKLGQKLGRCWDLPLTTGWTQDNGNNNTCTYSIRKLHIKIFLTVHWSVILSGIYRNVLVVPAFRKVKVQNKVLLSSTNFSLQNYNCAALQFCPGGGGSKILAKFQIYILHNFEIFEIVFCFSAYRSIRR